MAASSQVVPPRRLRVREHRVLALAAEVRVRGVTAVSSDSYVSPNMEKC